MADYGAGADRFYHRFLAQPRPWVATGRRMVPDQRGAVRRRHLVALAHPVTVLATALAAPLTSLNPTIGAGFVAAGVELWLRKPKVHDFATLRHDVTALKGWWRNRVSRTLLVFLFATLGSAAGTWIAGFRIAGALLGSGN